MHELPITKKLLDVALAHARRNHAEKIVSVHLGIGEMTDLEPEWLTKYFNHLARGTEAEGARVIVRTIPVSFQCRICDAIFPAPDSGGPVLCGECGEAREIALRSGREFTVDAIMIEDQTQKR